MLKFLIFIAMTCTAAIVPTGTFAESPDVAEVDDSFVVFNSIGIPGKPDLSKYGFRPIHVIYSQQFWPKNLSNDEPRENAVRTLARRAARRGHLVCIDIEHWPVGPKTDDRLAAQSIRKYAQVAAWMRDAEPGLRLGFYGLPPVRDYWSLVKGGEAVEQWKAANKRLHQLNKFIDVAFPSLYTFYEDRDQWVAYAKANLQEAHKHDRPVYAFLWPVYHRSNAELGGRYLPADYWRLQLETCRKYADGIVIWAWQPDDQWDENAPWWIETKRFMRELRETN